MKRVTLFTGHYGSGKTNLAVNEALNLSRAGVSTLIMDLDIVNPYFRTSDSARELSAAGVNVIASKYAGGNVDMPALPDEMYMATDDKRFHAIIDVGGDERGALALGRLAPALRAEDDYEMRFVVNFYRPLTQCAQDALNVMAEIEAACGLKFTGIVNNSNLGALTTAQTIIDTRARALELARRAQLPILQTTAREDICLELADKIENPTPITLMFKADWAIW